MLLPYLTDELGIAALWAGVIVFLPKAWDVVLNPIAGRVSDRTVDPAGPRRPWLLRAGLMLAGAFALIFAAPDLGSQWLEAELGARLLRAGRLGVRVLPGALRRDARGDHHVVRRTHAADDWRVAILAFTIMLAGATAPVIRDAVGGRDGYRVMGVVMSVLIVVGVVSAWWGTRNAPDRCRRRGRRLAARAAADRGPGPRLPGPAHHLRAPGAGDRLHARRRRLRRRGPARAHRRGDHPVRLLRRPGAAADAVVGAVRGARRQEAGLRHRVAGPGRGCRARRRCRAAATTC